MNLKRGLNRLSVLLGVLAGLSACIYVGFQPGDKDVDTVPELLLGFGASFLVPGILVMGLSWLLFRLVYWVVEGFGKRKDNEQP